MSPPVERSITASAPYFTAMSILRISGSMSGMSRDVPMLALTFTESPSPTAAGMGSWAGLQGMTMRPAAMPSMTNLSVTPSLSAIFLILWSDSPRAACSMMVLI